ncbi:hypothetical protein Rhopal_004031-T1 [Rhodotorula paludigena]|uniref:Proteophosphoglycan ppg4 n=1 Tax=Rhodotorula paludigena TaxID=86838 RepID=A0AAV5GNR7_9BASI|nr:hypothetical protein Rhopal_004031-T1 [Rhodotorula paludigena]
MATAAAPQPSPPLAPQQRTASGGTPSKPSHKRVFKTLSRFLGGGSSNKQRSANARDKQAQQGTQSPAPAAVISPLSSPSQPPFEGSTSPSRGRSRSSSRERRADDDGQVDGQGRRHRNDSVSAQSAMSGADTDALTVDSSSHASSLAPTHASTYKSYASTKPTTLLSVDSGGGANRIAVVPGTGTGYFGGAAAPQPSFSAALPASPATQSPISPASPLGGSGGLHQHRPSTSSTSSSISLTPSGAALSALNGGPGASPSLDLPDSPGVQGVPYHTLAHPRNNPHPAFPPADNASMLTLASSSFAPSFIGSASGGGGAGAAESTKGRNSWGTTAGGAGLRLFSGSSTKQQARSIGGGKGSLLSTAAAAGGGDAYAADEDASVRALAGSRRASEESLGGRSTWSALASGGGGVRAPGAAPSVRSRFGAARGEGAQGEEGDGASRFSRERKERRGSMRTVETSASGRAPSDEEEEVEDDRDAAVRQEDEVEEKQDEASGDAKGKAVDPSEHTGLAATAATFGTTLGEGLAPPVGTEAAKEDKVPDMPVESPGEASTPVGERAEGELVGEDSTRV